MLCGLPANHFSLIIIAQVPVHAIVTTPRDTLSATGKNEQPYKIHSLYI